MIERFIENIKRLSTYEDLSYLTNETLAIIQECNDIAAVYEPERRQEMLDTLEQVLVERGHRKTHRPRRETRWDNPRDGISFPETFA